MSAEKEIEIENEMEKLKEIIRAYAEALEIKEKLEKLLEEEIVRKEEEKEQLLKEKEKEIAELKKEQELVEEKLKEREERVTELEEQKKSWNALEKKMGCNAEKMLEKFTAQNERESNEVSEQELKAVNEELTNEREKTEMELKLREKAEMEWTKKLADAALEAKHVAQEVAKMKMKELKNEVSNLQESLFEKIRENERMKAELVMQREQIPQVDDSAQEREKKELMQLREDVLQLRRDNAKLKAETVAKGSKETEKQQSLAAALAEVEEPETETCDFDKNKIAAAINYFEDSGFAIEEFTQHKHWENLAKNEATPFATIGEAHEFSRMIGRNKRREPVLKFIYTNHPNFYPATRDGEIKLNQSLDDLARQGEGKKKGTTKPREGPDGPKHWTFLRPPPGPNEPV